MLIHQRKKLSRGGSSLSRADIRLLGNGPLRFAPSLETPERRSIQEQINALNASERSCFEHLKQKWEKKCYSGSSDPTYNNAEAQQPFSNEMILRFLRCSGGGGGGGSGGAPDNKAFHERSAWKVMKAYPQRCRHLTAASLEHQLQTKTTFPIPFLRTGEGFEVCYMRPCRVIAKPVAVSKVVLDSIAYTLGTMMENEQSCTNGVAVLFHMDGFSMSNFATDYWFNLMSMLQGKIVPVRVSNLFIVNPPTWFGNIWNLTKPMITLEFQAKVRMVANEEELAFYLESGYEEFLPDEMKTGQTSTNELVEDYITYRKAVEGSMTKQHSSSSLRHKTSTCGGKAVQRRNSLSSMNAAAVATFESFVPNKNPVARQRRNSISSALTFDAESSEPAPRAQQRRRNSIAASWAPFGDLSTSTTTISTTAAKPLMQRRRNSLSSAPTLCCSSPLSKNRQSVSVRGNFDSPNSKRVDGIITTEVYDSSHTSSKMPSIQGLRRSLSTSSQRSYCSSPLTKNRQSVSAREISNSPNSKRRHGIMKPAVCDSPTSSKKPSIQRRRGCLSSQGSSCSSLISNKPLMQRRRGSLSSQGSCASPVSRTSQRNLASRRAIPDSPNDDSPKKRWSEISAVCDSPFMKKRSSIFSTVPLCGDSPPGTTRQEQARQQRSRLERQSSFSSSFLDVPSLDTLPRGNSKRSVVMKSTDSSMHRSNKAITLGTSVSSEVKSTS